MKDLKDKCKGKHSNRIGPYGLERSCWYKLDEYCSWRYVGKYNWHQCLYVDLNGIKLYKLTEDITYRKEISLDKNKIKTLEDLAKEVKKNNK